MGLWSLRIYVVWKLRGWLTGFVLLRSFDSDSPDGDVSAHIGMVFVDVLFC